MIVISDVQSKTIGFNELVVQHPGCHTHTDRTNLGLNHFLNHQDTRLNHQVTQSVT